MKTIVAMMALGVALTSCSLTDKEIAGPEVVLNPTYKEKTGRQADAISPDTTWWANYHDENLNSLIEEALAQNLTVETARERVRAARLSASIANAAYLPSLSETYSRIRGTNTSPSGKGPSVVTERKALTSGTWTLDFFGAKSTQEEGQASIEVQKEALNAARLDLIYSMTSAYLTALGLNQEIAIAQKSLSVQKETLGITQAKVEAGSASTLDSTSASASVALTAADIPALQQSREESIHQIALLLGKEPSALQGVFGKYKPLPRPKVKFSEGIPADLIRNRPDIREAERQLQVAAAEIGISKAALYPTLSLSGTYTSTTIGANSATNIWSLGPSITLPIFDRGRLYKAVDLSRSEARQQYLTYRQTVIAAVGAVEDALVALRSERIRHARLSEAVAEYTKAESLARQLYSSGSSGFTDVLTAQASLYSAQKQLAVSSLTLSVDYATLCYALGGGWAGNEPVMTER